MAACMLSAWTTSTFNDKCGQHVDNELISDVNTFARSLFVLRVVSVCGQLGSTVALVWF